MVKEMDKKTLLPDVTYNISESGALIVGSASTNEYVKINCTNKEVVIDVLKMFDGNHSTLEIANYCCNNNIAIDMQHLEEVLTQRGLFLNTKKNKSNNEIELLGLKVFLKEFEYIPEYVAPKVVKIMCGIILLIDIIAVVLCAINYANVISIFKSDLLLYNDSYILGFGMTLGISTITLVMHECGHCLAALNRNVQIHKAGLFLYLGFIPKWFINFRGLRISKKSTKIQVFLGGVVLNVSCILIACSLYSYIDCADLIKCFIMSNLLMILNCMIPFSLTDGYFIFSTVFNVENLRIEMVNCLKNKKVTVRNKSGFIIYSLMSVIFWIYKLYVFYYWIYCILTELMLPAIGIILVLLFLHILLMNYNMKKKRGNYYD